MFGGAAVEFCSVRSRGSLCSLNTTEQLLRARASFVKPDPRLWLLHLLRLWLQRFYHPRKSAGEGSAFGPGFAIKLLQAVETLGEVF